MCLSHSFLQFVENLGNLVLLRTLLRTFGALQLIGKKLALGAALTTLGEPAPWLVVSTTVNSQNTFKLSLNIRYIPMQLLLVPFGKSSQWIQVHWAAFIMFWPKMEKLLNIEQLFSFKSKHQIIQDFVHTLGMMGKLLMG